MMRSLTSGPYESAVSMKVTPSSTARRSTRIASSWSRGSPHTPGPGICMAPYPNRATGKSPPMANCPLARAGCTARSLTMTLPLVLSRLGFGDELVRPNDEVDQRAVSNDGDRELPSDGIGQHEALERVRARDG